jgi:hypothetical protein
MDCCGLSLTGLNDIEANNITSDNITIFSNLNISGFSNLSQLLVNDNATFITSFNVSGFTTLNNKTTLLSLLNVSGFTNLDNTTNINESFYISGFNVLDTLNSYSTSLSILNNTTLQNQDTLITLGTGLLPLSNFRSDNLNALVTLVNDTTIIHGITSLSEIQFNIIGSVIDCLSKVDKDGKLCVYYPINVFLPTRGAGFWIFHDELDIIRVFTKTSYY